MKEIYGKDSGVIREYYESKRKYLDRDKKSAIRKLIRALAEVEAIVFMERFMNEKIYTVGDIASQFDFKNQFVEKNIMKHIDLNTLVLKKDIRLVLMKMLNEVLDKNKDTWFCSSSLAEEHLDISMKEVTITVAKAKECKKLLQSKKKHFVFEKDFKNFIVKRFVLVIDGQQYTPKSDILGVEWKSIDTLKQNLELQHNMQIYRLINNPSYGFVKLEYLNYDTSKRPNVARYAKL